MEAHRARVLLIHPIVVRAYLISLGIFAVLWAVQIFPTVWREPILERIASGIIEGQSFKVKDLLDFVPLIDNVERSTVCRPASLRSAAVIRLRITEAAIKEGGGPNVDRMLDELILAIRNSLKCAPADSFLWLVLYWAESTRSGFEPRYLDYLRLSYKLGPYEGWVALKRSQFALARFDQLSPALREQVLSEFAKLVNSGFYHEAAEILVGPGWHLRDQLLPRLEAVPERHRIALEWEIFELGYDAEVPGVVRPEARPWRR